MNRNGLTLRDFKHLINSIPDERLGEPVAVWIDNNGTRHEVINVDTLCDGVIDICVGEIEIE